MATKRIARWSEEDRKWLASLPPTERETVELLAAHLNATPLEDRAK
jgi:hypothetical protein